MNISGGSGDRIEALREHNGSHSMWEARSSVAGKIEMHALGGVGARVARDGCEGPKRLNWGEESV